MCTCSSSLSVDISLHARFSYSKLNRLLPAHLTPTYLRPPFFILFSTVDRRSLSTLWRASFNTGSKLEPEKQTNEQTNTSSSEWGGWKRYRDPEASEGCLATFWFHPLQQETSWQGPPTEMVAAEEGR